MSLFGQLKDIPLAHVLLLVEGRCGVLLLEDAPGGQCRIAVAGGSIRSVRHPYLSDGSPWAAQDYLVRLINGPQTSRFVFVDTEASQVPQQIEWSIPQVIRICVTKLSAGEIPESELFDVETVLVTSRADGDIIDDALDEQFSRVKPYLDGTSTIREIIGRHRLNETELLYTLAKLRLAGLVRPVRSFIEHRQPEAMRAQRDRGTLRRLLDWLRRGAA